LDKTNKIYFSLGSERRIEMNIDIIVRILRWAQDISGGEMIESPRHGYTRGYLVEDITFDQSETICELLNPLLIALNVNVILDFEDGKFINKLGKNR